MYFQIDAVTLDEDDLTMIGRGYLKEIGAKAVKETIYEEIDTLGLKPVPPTSTAKLRSCLIHFGRELLDNDLISLKKKGGLTLGDVTVKNI